MKYLLASLLVAMMANLASAKGASGGIPNCDAQSNCMVFTKKKMPNGVSSCTSDCVFQVCMTFDFSKTSCSKTKTISHVCDMADGNGCMRSVPSFDGDGDKTCSGSASDKKCAPESGYSLCQYGKAGDTLRFIVKDGRDDDDESKSYSSSSTSGLFLDSASSCDTVSCSNADSTYNCGGQSNQWGMERVWTYTLEDDCSDCLAVSNLASSTASPIASPTASPTESPTGSPTDSPTASPTKLPTDSPTASPTDSPTGSPTGSSAVFAAGSLNISPTSSPTASPTKSPTDTTLTGDVGIDIQKTVHLDHWDSCSVGQELEQGFPNTPVTYCYLITNTGKVPLTDIRVADRVVGFNSIDDAPAVLAPGESFFVGFQSSIDKTLSSSGVAVGYPANDDGTAVAGADPVTDSDPAGVHVYEPMDHPECPPGGYVNNMYGIKNTN